MLNQFRAGKYLEWAPHNCLAWTRYAQMEAKAQEVERARALFELAVNQQVRDVHAVELYRTTFPTQHRC